MTFEAQNQLETSLVRAATDAVHRPQFLRDFLEAPIFLIREGEMPANHSEGMLHAGEQLKLASWTIEGRSWLPIFSSLPRLQAALTEQKGYLRLKARDFLEITRGADVVLNPGASYGKYFYANEIAALLAGNYGMGEERVVQQATQVLLGSPSNYPQALADALTRLFKTRPSVRRAWIARIDTGKADEPAHTLIGLDVDGDARAIVQDAGVVARDINVPEPPVDIYVIQGKQGLSDYFLKSATPFYRKKFLGIF